MTKLRRLILLFGLACLMVLNLNWQPLWAKINPPNVTISPEYFDRTQERDRANAQHHDSLIQSKLSGINLLQQGQQLFQNGQFQAAVGVWQQAADSFAAIGDTFNHPLSLGYIASAWEQLGEWQRGQKAIAKAFQLLEPKEAKDDRNILAIRARLLNTQGQLQFSQGQESAALVSWSESAATYRQIEDTEGVIGTQVNQARALQALGLYRRAQKSLEEVAKIIAIQPDSLLKATALYNLGKTYWHLGDLVRSQQVLGQSLTISEKLARNDSNSTLALASLQSHTLLNLGNVVRVKGDYQQALAYYQQGIADATVPATKLEALVNQLSLLVETQQWQQAQTLWRQLKTLLTQLPVNRQTIYARINIANSLITMRQSNRETSDLLFDESDILDLLNSASAQAQTIGDTRSESTAIGILGYWYEQNQQWNQARQFTQQALNLAQAHQFSEIAYRWQWQLGRLLKVQGNTSAAIAAYNEAIATLQVLRNDLVAINSEIQFSFQEQVEPVYRQLVELLLQHSPQEKISQQNLRQARQTIELLQVAELENFFSEACLTAKPTEIDSFHPQTAVIYPIILSEKLGVILSLPQQPLSYYETAIAQSELEQLLDRMRQSLRQTSFEQERLPIAQQVYDLLIRPAEIPLAANEINTLVFVLDGTLKTLPMSALFDGDRYLVEKYSIVLAPGLQLLEPRSLKRDRLQGLIGALSEARQGFSPLPGVIQEIRQVSSQIATQVLLNQDFTRSAIHQTVKDSASPVLHLATHGQFSSSAAETFILAWDGKINVKELARWLQLRGYDANNPIELLVLSACETAAGDRRAALGMAGVAVRSGVRSTVASLWSVQDNSTAVLMTRFYQELLQTQANKAEALRRAQLKLLNQPEYQHPYYWASFVLIGNWL